MTKRFNAQTVRPSSHLQPTSEKAKRYHRKVNGIVQFRSAAVGPKPIDKPKDREFTLPRREDYKPPRLRGASGTRLSPVKRAMVGLRANKRRAFFAELGVTV